MKLWFPVAKLWFIITKVGDIFPPNCAPLVSSYVSVFLSQLYFGEMHSLDKMLLLTFSLLKMYSIIILYLQEHFDYLRTKRRVDRYNKLSITPIKTPEYCSSISLVLQKCLSVMMVMKENLLYLPTEKLFNRNNLPGASIWFLECHHFL